MQKIWRLMTALMLAGLLIVLPACYFTPVDSLPTLSTTDTALEYILVGRVVPVTGPLASFGVGTPYVEQSAIDYINQNYGGVYLEEEGRVVPLKLIYADSDSSSATAYEAAVKLIQEDGVDVMIVSNTADTVRPVAEACERYGVPCVSVDAPVDVWLDGGPYEYSFHAFFDTANELSCLIDGWDLAATNKTVGVVASDDFEGNEIATVLPATAAARGYQVVDPGRFTPGAKDYSQLINELNVAKCDIIAGVMTAEDFGVFWRQCHEMGYTPSVCTIAKANLFEADIKTLGPLGDGLICEVWWSVDYPYTSSINGWTANELAADYRANSGSEDMPSTVGYKHANVELIYDILRRAQSLDPAKVLAAAEATDLMTIAGPIKFDSNHACVCNCITGQWQLSPDGQYTQVIISNKQTPAVPVNGLYSAPSAD